MSSSYSSTTTSPEVRRRLHREIDYAERRRRHQKRLELDPNADSRAALVERAKRRILDDPSAADFLWSLFHTSLFSYRRSEICEPFPDAFVKEGNEKDFETVELYARALPELEHFAKHEAGLANLPSPALKVLTWAIDPESYEGITVKRIPLAQYKSEIKDFHAQQNTVSDPPLVFKVQYSEDHQPSQRFEELKQKHGSLMGFHGSPFENFHSILRNGLDASFGKESSLFGDGIYLSEDQDVAFSFLKPGRNAAPRSKTGELVGCLVCGEVIKHPKRVRTSESKLNSTLSGDSKLPKGYVVVEDNECVIVRYILVYNDFGPRTVKKMNICVWLAVLYVGILVFLWFTRSATFRNFYYRYVDQF